MKLNFKKFSSIFSLIKIIKFQNTCKFLIKETILGGLYFRYWSFLLLRIMILLNDESFEHFESIWVSKYEVEILHWIRPLSDMNGTKWYPCWQISLWILFFKQLWLLIFPGCRQSIMFSHFESLMHTVISTLILFSNS